MMKGGKRGETIKECPLNKHRSHDLTREELRQHQFFSAMSNDQLDDMIQTIKSLTIIVYNYYKNDKENRS